MKLSFNCATVTEIQLQVDEFSAACKCIELQLPKRKIIPITSISISRETYTEYSTLWN